MNIEVMQNPDISVIIPVYNTAPYLKESVESVINQSYKNVEIIIVNDGSTDGSEVIIRQLAAFDERIKVITQRNQGQSIARNVGLDVARGTYIYCMDSDDILNPFALQKCYEACVRMELDFLFFDGDILCEDGQSPLTWNYHRTRCYDENTVYKGVSLMEDMLVNETHRAVPWLLFIKRNHLETLHLRFYPGIIQEDELFTTLLFLQSHRIGCLKSNIVIHRVRMGSTMTTHFSMRNMNGYLTVADELTAFSKQMPSPIKKVIRHYLYYTLSRVFYTAHVMRITDKWKAFSYCIEHGYLKYLGIKTILVFWLK